MRRVTNVLVLVSLSLVSACDPDRGARDAGAREDAGGLDGGAVDGAVTLDADRLDADVDVGALDTGVLDTGARDGGGLDGGDTTSDGGELEASTSSDAASASDAYTSPDAFSAPDAFTVDAHVGGDCRSGASGTHAVRFRWLGSGPGSTAYVRYDVNELPDTSRWRVTANSRSIGYRPVFDDTFLAEGGLDLEGTAFIDVQLSLAGLTSLRGATLAIYGRSFHTTSSGSFEWQTFDGTGASGLVANSAPYEWYLADATTEFTAGDDGVLLRITPGPPSGALIVAAVEICFDAE